MNVVLLSEETHYEAMANEPIRCEMLEEQLRRRQFGPELGEFGEECSVFVGS
jgi:hypothetical protein